MRATRATYTNSTKIPKLKEKQKEALKQSVPSGDDASTQSLTPTTTRSQSNGMRTPACVAPGRATVYYQYTCVICGNKSVNSDFTKYRICESNRAKIFLYATVYFQDDVFRRTCDLQDEHAVYGADIYYHNQCMCKYIQQYERSRTLSAPVQLNAKQRVWNEIVDEIEMGLSAGKGYELSTIRDQMNSHLGGKGNIQNRDVKVLLYKQFNDLIDFAYSDSARKCLMGKEAYEHFHHERFITRNVRLDSLISRRKIQTMISIRNSKLKPTVKQTVRQVNITDKSIDIARHRLITTSELLKYDVVPSPMIFDADGYMTHPEKSLLIRELELVLTDADMHYRHRDNSAFIIDVMALVRRLPLQGLKAFGDLLTLMQKSLVIYHKHGSCEYVFDIYTGEPSIKDQEHKRRSTAPSIV